jgi:hypothetical protein
MEAANLSSVVAGAADFLELLPRDVARDGDAGAALVLVVSLAEPGETASEGAEVSVVWMSSFMLRLSSCFCRRCGAGSYRCAAPS